jgi:hypothetical protein
MTILNGDNILVIEINILSGHAMKDERNRKRRMRMVFGLGVLFEVAATYARSGRLGGNLVVRCRQGHLFTTLWIPAASVKSLRLGPWRVQHCPVGHHWTIVTPVKKSELGEAERRAAAEHRDVRLP